MARNIKTWLLAIGVFIILLFNHTFIDHEWIGFIGETMVVAYFVMNFLEERIQRTEHRKSIYAITAIVVVIWIYEAYLTLTNYIL